MVGCAIVISLVGRMFGAGVAPMARGRRASSVILQRDFAGRYQGAPAPNSFLRDAGTRTSTAVVITEDPMAPTRLLTRILVLVGVLAGTLLVSPSAQAATPFCGITWGSADKQGGSLN